MSIDAFAIEKTLKHFGIDQDVFKKVHDSFQYKPFSIEAFLFGEETGISYSIPNRLVKYVKDNELGIDTSLLEKCIIDRDRSDKISDRLCDIMWFHDRNIEEYVKETIELCNEEDSLMHSSFTVLNQEVLRIKEAINNFNYISFKEEINH